MDFQLTRDTLLIDAVHGKALIDLTVREGPRYRVNGFEARMQRFADRLHAGLTRDLEAR